MRISVAWCLTEARPPKRAFRKAWSSSRSSTDPNS